MESEPSTRRLVAVLLASALGAAHAAPCKVAVDIGHTRQEPGATSARGVGEWQFNARLADRLGASLTRAGVAAIVLNPDGQALSLHDRPRAAKEAGATLFISLHHDSVQPRYLSRWVWEGHENWFSDSFHGYSLFISGRNPESTESKVVAMKIGDTLLSSGLRPSLHHAEQIPGEGRALLDSLRGVYQFDDLAVLREAPMPAVLIEAGVVANRDEELEVATPAYQEKVVSAVLAAAKDHCERVRMAAKP